MERLLWAGADEHQGRSVVGSDQRRIAARLRRQPILQVLTKYQITDDIQVGGLATYPSKIYAARCWPRTRAQRSELLAVRYFCRRQSRQELPVEALRATTSSTRLTTTPSIKVRPFSSGWPGRVVGVEVAAKF